MKDWTSEIYNLEKSLIRTNIEYNDYYHCLKKSYEKDKDIIISTIYDLYKEVYQGYYSIYTIMDTLESYLEEDNGISLEDILEDPNFEINEYF